MIKRFFAFDERRKLMLASVKSFLIAFAVALLIFGLIGYFAMPQIKSLADGFFTPGEVDPSDTETVTYVAPAVPDAQTGIIGKKAAFEDHKSFTMLLIGSDYQPGVFSDYRISVQNSANLDLLSTHQRHYKADVIMLVRYNASSGIFMMSAIPPNLMVTSAGIQMRLGEALEKKGAAVFTELVSSVIGMSIDYYICCRIALFEDIINRIGGVSYDVPTDMYYVNEEERIVTAGASRDPIPLVVDGKIVTDSDGNPVMIPAGRAFTINLKRGVQALNGEKAGWVLRYNVYPNGFAGRRETQVGFFRALFESLFNQDKHDLLSGIVALIGSSATGETNMTVTDFEDISETMLSYARYDKTTVIFPCTVTGSGAEERISFSRGAVYNAYDKF